MKIYRDKIMRCVYCFSETNEFNKEHVIPKSLGLFEGQTLTISKRDKLVCKKCNSDFGDLENIFKKDSREGIHAQMLNLMGENSVRIKNQRCKIVFQNPLGDFFNNMFHFLKFDGTKLIADRKPQIQFRFNNDLEVYRVEALENLKKKKKEWGEMKDRIKELEKKDIQIFTPSNFDDNRDVIRIIELLKELGCTYNEKESQHVSNIVSPDSKLTYEYECNHNDLIIPRVLAKIAFNYFIYSAQKSGLSNILFQEEFNPIRDFIIGKSQVAPIKRLGSWKGGLKEIAHTIAFSKNAEWIVSDLSLFNLERYQVILGKYPKKLEEKYDFGSGHVFHVLNKEILQLTRDPERKELRFGLFCG